MPKKRAPGRKKKSVASSGSSKSKKGTSKTPTKSPNSSKSDTSPFKGFEDTPTNFKVPKLYESLTNGEVSDTNDNSVEEEKNALFDKLVDDNYKSNLNRNIKTYSNKRKEKCTHGGLLDFHDCRNRDNIVQWLNDNRNVFDRLSQTQKENVVTDTQVTLDMPSVSQQKSSTMNRSHRESKRERRSPYKLRARSLDIQVKKNSSGGRSKRHSLAGDTPEMENYHIEEALTDIGDPIPAENDAIYIIDLMEDEYLDNIEKEMQKNPTGWDRMKDFNKTIKTKQLKQLEIKKESPIKKDTDLINNNNYDHDAMEVYFMENMKLLEGDASKKTKSENCHKVGKEFLVSLQKLLESEGEECLNEFRPLWGEFKKIFDHGVEVSTQTVNHCDHKFIQTEVDTASAIIQTESNATSAIIQTDLNLVDSIAQTEEKKNTLQRTSSTTSSTASNLFFADENERREITAAFATDFSEEEKEEEKPPEVDNFDDDFHFSFNTEDILKNSVKEEENVPKTAEEDVPKTAEENVPKTAESVLVVSEEQEKSKKAMKRSRSGSPLGEEPKRPCAKFIDEELSIAFASCVEEKRSQDKGALESNESQPPLKTRTQEQIEELENMIYNATKAKRSPLQVENETTPDHPAKLEDALEYFEPSSDIPVGETTPKKSRRDLFDSKKKINSFSESMFGNEENVTVVESKTLTEDKVEPVKVNILQNVVLKEGVNKFELSQSDDDMILSCDDVVESTPQKNYSRQESALDVTLPPPLEFQDSEKHEFGTPKCVSPPRRPLAVINKITSTPLFNKPDSESFLTLSPISHHSRHHSPESFQENRKPTQENRTKRTPGPYELAQRQANKFCPLTIIKRPLSQDIRLSATPKKQKTMLNYIRPSQESQTSQKSESFDGSFRLKPCIACSRVNRDQVMAISSLTNKKLANYSTSFTPKVTHLIVAVNEKNCVKDHTIKFVLAVASGVWVLNFNWVQQCLLKNTLVPEEPYEVLDVTGLPGPKKARLMRTTKPLFKGYKIYAAAPFATITKEEVENVVRLLGGKVASSPEQLIDKNGYLCVIVTEVRATQDFELYETWLDALKVVTVDLEWLSRSVGQYQILSLRPFTLCPEETIDNLGYPPELTANMTYSFSQQTFSSVPST